MTATIKEAAAALIQRVVWKKLSSEQRARICWRPAAERELAMRPVVQEIFDQVRKGGEAAVRAFGKKFDKVDLPDLRLSEAEKKAARAAVAPEDRAALEHFYRNVRKQHEEQWRLLQPLALRHEIEPGITSGMTFHPIQRLGFYIPAGEAPLFSTIIMLGAPSQIAGSPSRIICTPPKADGSIHPMMVLAADLCGIDEIYKVGGAHAVAFMALCKGVQKIFGPGSPVVVAAKREIAATMDGVAVDMPAGASEVMIVADKTANPAFIAADCLAQLEHGDVSQAKVIVDDAALFDQIEQELQKQMADLPRGHIAGEALKESTLILVDDVRRDAPAIVEQYAPEHLLLQIEGTNNAIWDWARALRGAGSIFIGHSSAEVFGDYGMSGDNHLIPTQGNAGVHNPINMLSFVAWSLVTAVEPSAVAPGSQVVADTARLARQEGLEAHARAAEVRQRT